MFNRLKQAWRAARSAYRLEPSEGFLLQEKQTEALIELHALFRLREPEMKSAFPDLAYTLHELLQSNRLWEWFPIAGTAQGTSELIVNDMTRRPENYTIITNDTTTSNELKNYRLLSPGIRDLKSGKALYKAKIAIYQQRSAESAEDLLNDLNDL
ncbi:hypothetical protein SY83_17830 [Paenibacillus swuensis]|uniref:Uncharacterized protein n=1 Tax=Paenibacillus swuensis TaxID=1178515 RepID=A0A172TLQ8_9BACL|nr:hypothetical protein [Paenibacillus swuensis]ANE47844.1 hypothetical protein SY83_17830 [Paenibacillus swuensis]